MDRIQKFLFPAIAEHLVYLAMRWNDEKEYEDFNDYEASVQHRLPAGFTMIKMTKKPFGFHFNISGDVATYRIFANVRGVVKYGVAK